MTYTPKYFKWSEFDQPGYKGSGETYMNRDFVKLLDELRERCGFPLIITSGYRSPEYNSVVSTTGENGPHTTGRAVDIRCNGQTAYTILHHVFALGFTGIGIKQRDAGRFIHIDTITNSPRPNVWTY
jgi:zinc D-Ala-D-Ala carboxypeptidase